ncbi:MAG: hypothetical protein Q9181_008108, partial [Wetmoreana brouardii]
VNPYLEAIIEVNPDAADIAAELDDERLRGKVRGSLHGVPVLVKDNMATRDRMQTTAGSWALLGSVVRRDAHIVSRLRDAGAVILGHANMSEWASVRSKEYSEGYSPRGGQVRNPFDLSRTPFSANIVPLSFGTETDSSIIGPALINGVVGIKPTPGLTSRSGVVPISYTMDTVGSFGRTVADAVGGLNVIVGQDDRDALTFTSECDKEEDYSRYIKSRKVLQGAKFGLPRKRCWDLVDEDQKTVALKLFNAITDAGATIVDTNFPCAEDRIPSDGEWDWEYGEPNRSEFTVVKVEAYNAINKYLSELSNTPIQTLDDLISYNDRNGGTEGANQGDTPGFASGQDDLREIVATRGEKNKTYHEALKYIQDTSRKQGIDAALRSVTSDNETIELDALLICDRKGAGQMLAAQAGYPIISIPIGIDAIGLPVGLSIQQRAWKEAALIKWASAIEDLVHHIDGWRPTPEYKESMSKNIPITTA